MNPNLDFRSAGAARTALIFPSVFVQEKPPDAYTVWGGIFENQKLKYPQIFLEQLPNHDGGAPVRTAVPTTPKLVSKPIVDFFVDFFSA